MGSIRHILAALACVCATSAHATSSSVTVNDISYNVTDLAPDDGVAASVVFNPTFDFASEAQAANVDSSMSQGFMDLRCFDCPMQSGSVEIYQSDDATLAGRTLAPQSQFLGQRIVEHLVGVTPGTQVTVSFDVSFNEPLTGPIGGASFMLVMHGYELLPNDDFAFVTSEGGHSLTGQTGRATVEATFANKAGILAPLHFAQVMEVSGETTALPESDTTLLIALGLGLVAWQGRKALAA